MARKFGKINQMGQNFEDYNYMILGQGAIGKTTMAYELGRLVAGNDEGTMIITLGQENTTTHIPNAFGDVANTFVDLRDIIDDLVDNRIDYGSTKFVALDSVDELFRIADQYVVDEYNRSVDVDKRVKSINQAYGGFQNGQNRTIDLVCDMLSRLNKAGYRYILIGHTKVKSKTDPVTNISYDQLSCNLDNKYYTAIKDKVNLVATGYFEKTFENLKKKDNPYTKEKGAVTVGNLVGERRVLALMDNEMVIDTKSHFEYIVPKTDFSAESLIKAVTDAIAKKVAAVGGPHASNPLPDPREEQIAAMRANIRAKYKDGDQSTKSKIKEILGEDKLDVASEEKLVEISRFLEI